MNIAERLYQYTDLDILGSISILSSHFGLLHARPTSYSLNFEFIAASFFGKASGAVRGSLILSGGFHVTHPGKSDGGIDCGYFD